MNQTNNFQNSENEMAQDFKGANIEKQINIFFPKLELITKKYKAKELNWLEFMFLFFFRFILLCFIIMLLLLPFFSTNQDKISFWLFGGVIVVFILLFNWIWSNKIYKNKD